MDLCWCDCLYPIPYRDYSTITAHGMLACKRCDRFLNNEWLEHTKILNKREIDTQ